MQPHLSSVVESKDLHSLRTHACTHTHTQGSTSLWKQQLFLEALLDLVGSVECNNLSDTDTHKRLLQYQYITIIWGSFPVHASTTSLSGQKLVRNRWVLMLWCLESRMKLSKWRNSIAFHQSRSCEFVVSEYFPSSEMHNLHVTKLWNLSICAHTGH